MALTAVMALAQPARADEDTSAGPETFAGVSVECRDIRGRPVRTYRIINLGDVGRAGVVNRVPIIALDPNIMALLPDKMQLFFYLHECAHHVLGHWMAFAPEHENDAEDRDMVAIWEGRLPDPPAPAEAPPVLSRRRLFGLGDRGTADS